MDNIWVLQATEEDRVTLVSKPKMGVAEGLLRWWDLRFPEQGPLSPLHLCGLFLLDVVLLLSV